MTDNEYKNCPYCDEEIKVNAIKCRYCQSFLDKENDSPKNEKSIGRKANSTEELDSTLTKTGTSLMTIGCLLTLFITIPIIFILFLGGC